MTVPFEPMLSPMTALALLTLPAAVMLRFPMPAMPIVKSPLVVSVDPPPSTVMVPVPPLFCPRIPLAVLACAVGHTDESLASAATPTPKTPLVVHLEPVPSMLTWLADERNDVVI